MKSRLHKPSNTLARRAPAPKRPLWRRLFARKHRFLWVMVSTMTLGLGAITWHLLDEATVQLIVRLPAGRPECRRWVEHLREAGYRVWVEEEHDRQATRRTLHVPEPLAACHSATTVQGGRRYAIEGHVPADAISRLLAERPAIRGLAVPGTPDGAPGVEGPNPQPYVVWAFSEDGTAVPYAQMKPGPRVP